jgi:hypothetical protein
MIHQQTGEVLETDDLFVVDEATFAEHAATWVSNIVFAANDGDSLRPVGGDHRRRPRLEMGDGVHCSVNWVADGLSGVAVFPSAASAISMCHCASNAFVRTWHR